MVLLCCTCCWQHTTHLHKVHMGQYIRVIYFWMKSPHFVNVCEQLVWSPSEPARAAADSTKAEDAKQTLWEEDTRSRPTRRSCLFRFVGGTCSHLNLERTKVCFFSLKGWTLYRNVHHEQLEYFWKLFSGVSDDGESRGSVSLHHIWHLTLLVSVSAVSPRARVLAQHVLFWHGNRHDSQRTCKCWRFQAKITEAPKGRQTSDSTFHLWLSPFFFCQKRAGKRSSWEGDIH